MQRTIDLPDDLAQRLDAYLQEHPEETFSSLIREALETKLTPKDISTLLTLAGIVTEAPYYSTDHAEDREI
jgi:metal-responsive CopG/Arc/MetJ family transcriptional regulator